MMYLGEDELTQTMGMGYLGEVRQGPDGSLYQWVQGVDGLGNPVGFWKSLKRFARRYARYIPQVAALRAAAPFLRRVLPIAQRVASFIPLPQAQAVTAGLKAATPILQQAGVAGYDGLGALYEAPDGTLYQVQGLAEEEELRGLAEDDELRGFAEDEELRGLGEDELTQVMGMGHLGEVRQGPDGNLYQWVQGVDGLGNPVGFWQALRRRLKRLVRRALPLAQRFAPFIPGVGPAVAAGLRAATPILQRAGVAGQAGLGALYEAPDGTLYQVQGLAEDDELRGLAQDDELRGFAEDEELRGLAEDEELRGLAEDEELRGLAEEEELRGMEGYVQEDAMSGLEAYVPDQPAGTPMFVRPAQTPDMWRPLW